MTLASLFQLNETERRAIVISLRGLYVMDERASGLSGYPPTAYQMESRIDGENLLK
ncbi:MAG: hypothetical protein RXQ22_09930 [Sulfolobus sp.]